MLHTQTLLDYKLLGRTTQSHYDHNHVLVVRYDTYLYQFHRDMFLVIIYQNSRICDFIKWSYYQIWHFNWAGICMASRAFIVENDIYVYAISITPIWVLAIPLDCVCYLNMSWQKICFCLIVIILADSFTVFNDQTIYPLINKSNVAQCNFSVKNPF